LWYLAPLGIVAVVLAAAAESTDMSGLPVDWVIRAAALLGYQFVFMSIISSAYMVQLVRRFGRPFVQMHHVLSVAGLIMVSLHPLAVALRAGTAKVFLPRFDSLRLFLELGGRPAWYFIVVAALVALWRRRLGSTWRVVHMLNYVAFLLATVHGNLIGTNFQNPVTRAVSALMVVAVVAVFVRKRIGGRRPAQQLR
jgi:DMSO/TMAO reductase YedYZ heme-binding membrane subunit